MRELSEQELSLLMVGGQDTGSGGGTIIVTGRRYSWIYRPPPWNPYAVADPGGYGSTGGGDDAVDNSQNPQPANPGDVPCKTAAAVAALTPAERDRYNVQRTAGRIHRQIVDRSDSGDTEYASIIYRNHAGAIVFTPLPPSGAIPGAWDTSALDTDTSLWKNVLGVIHNHPHHFFDPNNPAYYATPSFDHPDPNTGQMRGDWITFDAIKKRMVHYGASQGTADNLVQYISSMYTGGMLKLFEYENWDRDNVTVGKDINPALDHCPS